MRASSSKQDRPVRRFKRALVQIHLWLGLVLGAVWAFQGLTGALLVFHRELDRSSLGEVKGPSLPLDELMASATRATRLRPESIGLYYPDPSLLGVTFAEPDGSKRSVLVSVADGAVIAERARTPASPAKGNFWRWIYNLHHGLLMGERGHTLLGASGLVLLVMASSGVYLAWPRKGHWRAAFAANRWRTRLQQWFGWHRCAGLLVATALVILATSGALMDFGKPLRSWAERYAGFVPPYKPAPDPVPALQVGAQAALNRALARFPQAAFTSLVLPSENAPVYQVRLRQPGEWRQWSGTSVVVINPGDGRVLAAYDASTAPLANRVLESAFAVHSGEVAGPPGRVLTFAAGLALPVLYLTGLAAWLRKLRLRASRLGAASAGLAGSLAHRTKLRVATLNGNVSER